MPVRPGAHVACLLLAALGCAREQWHADLPPISAELLQSELHLNRGDLRADEIPLIREPRQLRPCCAFGSSLRVKLGPVPLPGVQLPNLLDPDGLGHHEYDGGLPLTGQVMPDSFVSSERNGLVFTCRSGFVDTAHLRLWADYTLYLASWTARNLEAGGTLPIHDEGGRRRIVLEPFPEELLESHPRRQLAVPVAQWLAWQMSVWHEIVTWYGWSHLPTFPELASAFSPEDFYSNALGIRIAGALIRERMTDSEDAYNDAMTGAMLLVFELLGARPAEVGRAAALHLDGRWWDSSAKLPSKEWLLRRNFEVGGRIVPWRVEDAGAGVPEEVAEACGDAPVHGLSMRFDVAGLPIQDFAGLEIEVSEALLAAGFPLPRMKDRRIDQEGFPGLIEVIRAENAREFGPFADRPGDPAP